MSKGMMEIKVEPILLAAEAYSNKPVPFSQQERVVYLYEFGTNLFGEMERMLNHALRTQRDMVNLSLMPIAFRKVEVPLGPTTI